jgi:cell division protein FtsB
MAPRSSARTRQRRTPRSRVFLRWLGLGVVVLVAGLYYRPVKTYVHTHATLTARRAEVQALTARKHALERRLAATSSDASLAKEARRLGFVRPGEHLFIVKGISAWRRARLTIEANG